METLICAAFGGLNIAQMNKVEKRSSRRSLIVVPYPHRIVQRRPLPASQSSPLATSFVAPNRSTVFSESGTEKAPSTVLASVVESGSFTRAGEIMGLTASG